MKSLLIVILFIVNSLSAHENYELKLYEKILPSIFKKDLLIYADTKTNEVLKNTTSLNVTLKCVDADLLLGKEFKNLSVKCKDKPVFATSYRSFTNNPNAIGAFYWRKGRPQIKFKLDTLKMYNIQLPKNLIEYAK